MYSIESVLEGIISYIKKEVISILPGYAKVLAGAALIHNTGRIGELLSTIAGGTILNTLDVVDQSGNIDVDIWCQDLKRSMDEFSNGRLTISFPGSNSIILGLNDIDTLKRYIKGELR